MAPTRERMGRAEVKEEEVEKPIVGVAAAAAEPRTSSLVAAAREELVCSVCLEVSVEPAALPCGHAGCTQCLEAWFLARRRRLLRTSCPRCAATFRSPPALKPCIPLRNLARLLAPEEPVRAPPPEEELAALVQAGMPRARQETASDRHALVVCICVCAASAAALPLLQGSVGAAGATALAAAAAQANASAGDVAGAAAAAVSASSSWALRWLGRAQPADCWLSAALPAGGDGAAGGCGTAPGLDGLLDSVVFPFASIRWAGLLYRTTLSKDIPVWRRFAAATAMVAAVKAFGIERAALYVLQPWRLVARYYYYHQLASSARDAAAGVGAACDGLQSARGWLWVLRHGTAGQAVADARCATLEGCLRGSMPSCAVLLGHAELLSAEPDSVADLYFALNWREVIRLLLIALIAVAQLSNRAAYYVLPPPPTRARPSSREAAHPLLAA